MGDGQALGGWIRRLIASLIVSAVLLPVSGFPSSVSRRLSPVSCFPFEFTQPHMGTMVRLVIYARDEGRATAAARAAFARIADIDATLSDYRAESELSRVSRRAGEGPVGVSRDLMRVAAASGALANETDGAFDITIGRLTALWRQARRDGRLPDAASLQAARAASGYRWLVVDEAAGTLTLTRAGVRLDAGGIGKGYAADQAAHMLVEHGIESFLVAASGDIVVGDPPPGQRGWEVAIENGVEFGGGRPLGLHRRERRHTQPRSVLLRNAAISTSGHTEQSMVVDGVRYSHILDPRTGVGVTDPLQVTVIAPSGIEADALATAVAVLGPDRGVRLIEGRRGTSVLLHGPHGAITSSRWPVQPDSSGSTRAPEERHRYSLLGARAPEQGMPGLFGCFDSGRQAGPEGARR
jgi:thiamine biosynthesis lipoprotein